ncbi:hypothetical protein B0H13DRAFT_1605096, partial [Mycena leptocephala]
KPLPTEGRPKAVHLWTKSGRNPKKPPSLQADFTEHWWAWWSALALPGGSETARLGNEGPWGELVHPGANGILMVLLALAWWREEETTPSMSWLAAVKDVGWVLSGLLTSAR